MTKTEIKTLKTYNVAIANNTGTKNWQEVATGHQAINIFEKLSGKDGAKLLAKNRVEIDGNRYILS
jgi:hypothetical protein